MTLTADPPPVVSPQPEPPRNSRRGLVVAVLAVLVAGALGAGLALGLGGSPTPAEPSTYSFYQSMMGNYGGGSMMGGGPYGSMMGASGYQWMIGGPNAPGWMTGGSLPGYMMGTNDDPGTVMGRFWAGAPGPRVSPAEAKRLGDQVPHGATVDRAANRITFTSSDARLTVEASPSMPDESFRIAGLTNPTLVVPRGTTVTIELINADSDMAHGLVVTARGAESSEMPMMADPPAFPGAALWFLGESTSAGMHEGSLTFAADRSGTYAYLCPVPGHAQKGMVGTFLVGQSS
jgi:rusticyanin